MSSADPLNGKKALMQGRNCTKPLAEKLSERNVSIGELRSGGQRRAVVKARGAMSWIGIKELGYSEADVAGYLGVTNSCVTRMISAGGKQDIDDINLEL